ncbi:MAG TPA: hypothetical protein VFI23_13585 [Rhizomicrobium sp.]|nr:hypothetical protein [Rhizomicrobium sp.]
MMAEVLRHGWNWIALGLVMLVILARQLWTGKVVTKGWIVAKGWMGFLRIYQRETDPWAFWSWVALTGGSAILLLGFGIFQVIQSYQ